MGKKKNNKYHRDLKQQVYDRLTSMQAFGEKKSLDRITGTTADKIYSFSTYETYRKHCNYFADYIKAAHPEVRNLKEARKYVVEWLRMREDEGLSAWTIQTEAKALGKLYGITPEDKDYYTPPQRHRSDIKRSRRPTARDSHFSEEKNKDFVEFCRGTGLRHREIEVLSGDAYMCRSEIKKRLAEILEQEKNRTLTPTEAHEKTMIKDALAFSDINDFVYVRNGKGGRTRIAPIMGEHTEEIIAMFKTVEPTDKVWPTVPVAADVHGYRGDYATAVYKRYARDIDKIPADSTYAGINQPRQSEVYVCRKDRAGVKYDRKAMLLCSKALGHNRISVVADNYLYNLE